MAKLFVKLNVRLSTLLHTKLKEKTTSIILMITNKKKNHHHPLPQKRNEKNKTNLKIENQQKKNQKCECVTKKQQWSRPDESIVFFSEMVGYYHGFFYQVYALCSMMIIINNSCKHILA